MNYLSIWPFMRHPWFPTRNASKLTFACFQLAGWWPCDCFQLAGWCPSPASWKQTNISFEPPWKNFLFDISAIHSSIRHEKHCQMSLGLFSLFRGSISQQCRACTFFQKKKINVGPWIGVGHEQNVHSYVTKKNIKLENLCGPWKKLQNLINIGSLISL